MTTWYNDNESFAVQWLRNLIEAEHLPKGVVDDRPIQEIQAKEVSKYEQAHFFAGIGGWPLALKQAGWPKRRRVWTGSCPCQPFSVAGRRGGTTDERHLWPEWFRLIKECRPPVIFGEQLASKDGYAWFDLVQADLEGLGYACGMVVSPAAGYGAPHSRHRIYFVANTTSSRCAGREKRGQRNQKGKSLFSKRGQNGAPGPQFSEVRYSRFDAGSKSNVPQNNLSDSFWANAEWLPCTDGKARPTQPGLFPLAHGVPARVGRLRAYGNAIVIPQAVEFIRAYMDVSKNWGDK